MVEHPILRTVVEEKLFADDLNRLSHKYPRMEEVKRAIDWMVARNPLSFEQIPGFVNYYILKTTDVESGVAPMPSFLVLFRYDEEKDPNNVYLVSIEEVTIYPEEM